MSNSRLQAWQGFGSDLSCTRYGLINPILYDMGGSCECTDTIRDVVRSEMSVVVFVSEIRIVLVEYRIVSVR